MGHEVELASASATRAFTDFQEATLSPKSIQGKILSMELTGHVKPAPKVEAVRTYSPSEEETFVSMVQDGAFVEAIASALGRSVNSVRVKALSLLRCLSAADYDGASKKEKASA